MKKHSVTIAGHRTSISLEDEFWQGLKTLAAGRRKSMADIIRQIDRDRGERNLSSAIRVTVLNHYKKQLSMVELQPTAQQASSASSPSEPANPAE